MPEIIAQGYATVLQALRKLSVIVETRPDFVQRRLKLVIPAKLGTCDFLQALQVRALILLGKDYVESERINAISIE